MWKKDSTDDKNVQTNGMEINLITWQHLNIHTHIQHSVIVVLVDVKPTELA